MAICDQGETRAFARLPGLDIAIVHCAASGNRGEQVMIALRAMPYPEALEQLTEAADPLLFWSRLTHAMWASWLGCLATIATPPWIIRSQ